MVFIHIVCLLNSIFINSNTVVLSFNPVPHIQYFYNFDNGFIDGHVIYFMILCDQYAFSSPAHLSPVA